ncbi:MAG: hypothetical protein LBN08_01600 [Lactobacillales bacterium]|jgi:hypothetical protein|nr:hypothetical protein [Lactobacillales bacterium]
MKKLIAILTLSAIFLLAGTQCLAESNPGNVQDPGAGEIKPVEGEKAIGALGNAVVVSLPSEEVVANNSQAHLVGK